MELEQIEINWNIEPNDPTPTVEICGSNIKLYFYLNPFSFHHYHQDNTGVIEFLNCRQYSMTPPKDRGFLFNRRSVCNKYGVKRGELYIVKKSEGRHHFARPVMVNPAMDSESLNHYVLCFRDEKFQCLAKGFSYRVTDECLLPEELNGFGQNF